MASATALSILLGFYAAFCNLDLLEQATGPRTQQSGGRLAGVATSAFAPAVLATFLLTLALLLAHVRALAGASAGGAGGIFLVRLLAKATVLAAAATLLAGSVLRLGAGGYLGGGADDVRWLNVD